jgi:hypothetical protein
MRFPGLFHRGRYLVSTILRRPPEAAMKKSTLEKLRQEIEKDTKAAQSEPERLERRRMEKLLGPLEYPPKQEKERDRGMER